MSEGQAESPPHKKRPASVVRVSRPQDGDPVSAARRGRDKGRCDVCSAGVPPAMVVYRRGLVLSPMDMDTVSVPVAAVVPDPALSPGLLGRLWRPSVARSAWSKGRTGRIATTLPALRRPHGELGEMLTALSPWVARYDNVREVIPGRRDLGSTLSNPARPGERCVSCPVTVSGAVTECCHLRPSGPPLAPQRRAISVVGEQNGEDCDHADHANGGLMANLEKCSQRCRRGLPGMVIVRGARRRREV